MDKYKNAIYVGEKMITNRYYIATIIAIFLSLSLGILIGGTLGQQWLNDSQQKLIDHYEQKALDLGKTNSELKKAQEERNKYIEKIENDYKTLFNSSITNILAGSKILWLNDSNQSYLSLRNTIEATGGTIYDLGDEESYQAFKAKEIDPIAYDVVLFFPNNSENLTTYTWLLDYNVPVVYVTTEESPEKLNNKEIKMLEQKVDIASLNEQYQFVNFLKNLLQER